MTADSEQDETDTGTKRGTKLAVPKRRAMARLRERVSESDPMAVVIFETRLLMAATVAVLVAMIIWTVSVSTDFWFHVSVPGGGALYINRTNSFFVRSHSGIWTICKYIIQNGSMSDPVIRTCHNHRLFPTIEQIQKNPEVDRTILDYTRTEIAFAIISFCLMFMGLGFSIYTFKEPRYTFKRLAGGVHFISAAAILVVIEVVINSVNYEEQYLNDRHPKGAQWSYGYSFIIAWFTFIILIICGIVFIVCSRKKKGDRGINSGADDPQVFGRI